MAQGMEQGMRQTMVATATMQMFMRALQATTTELEQITAEALSTNPALEELPPPEPEDDAPAHLDYEATRRHDFVMDSLAAQETLCSHLQGQLRRNALPKDEEAAALELCSCLDSHGRFTDPPEQLGRELGIPAPLLRKALKAVQDLEPAGVGAVDLRESLILQLQRAGESRGIPMRLLKDHWDDLVRHRYAEAAKAMELEEEAVVIAARRIARLNPDPGSEFACVEQQVIEPDILVTRKTDNLGRPTDEMEVTLTGYRIPRLGLSADYRNMMAERADNVELRRYLSKCFRDGRELIKAISDRQATVLAIAQAIVQRQHAFFLQGPHALLPLRMEEVADMASLHISTVSRAVRGKFLRCDFGVFELRAFFTTALPAAEGADPVSASAIQARIRDLIAEENPLKPLSDAKLESLLAAEGVTVARRTIAKYRDRLKILPASLRKKG